jgi:prepilin peptidase CpaA
MVRDIFILLFAGAAALFDWRTLKIPNVLLLFGAAGGFLWSWQPVYLIRLALPLLLLYPLYYLRMMGAGDVKLCSVYGGLLGFQDWKVMFFLSLFLAALWSVYRIWSKGLFRERLLKLTTYATDVLASRRLRPYFIRGVDPDSAVIPMAVPMFLAVVIVRLSHYKEVIEMWIHG